MIQPDEIIRSNRKTLAISIDSRNRLIVRAPKRYAQERIFAFLQQKESWILRKRAERAETIADLPSEDLDGYSFLLLGKPCKISLSDGDKITYDEENSRLYLPKKNAKTRLVKWLKENAKRIFTAVTEREGERMGVKAKSVAVSSAKGKWGSCAYDNAVRYTFRLLYCPREVIDYVVIHELAHTIQHNHSKQFWQVVEKYSPDWKDRRKWLKAHGILMEIF